VSRNKKIGRRKALKTFGGIALFGTAVGLGSTQEVQLDNTPCQCGGDSMKIHTEETEIQRREYGHDRKYYTSAGSTLEQIDSVYYPKLQKWSYVFRTESTANAVKEYENGDTVKYEVYDASKGLEVIEQNKQGEINTQYYSDSDWGYGVTSGGQKNYDWQDATVDTIRTLEQEFVPVVSQLHSAMDIVSYWKQAAKDDNKHEGIEVNWNGHYEPTSHLGTYVFYEHKFPPKSKFSDKYVYIDTTNRLNNSLFYTKGTEYPNGDYTHTYQYRIYVKEEPESSSNSDMKEVHISNYHNQEFIENNNLEGESKIFVDNNPIVEFLN